MEKLEEAVIESQVDVTKSKQFEFLELLSWALIILLFFHVSGEMIATF